MISLTCWTDGGNPCNPFQVSEFASCGGLTHVVATFTKMHAESPQKSPQCGFGEVREGLQLVEMKWWAWGDSNSRPAV